MLSLCILSINGRLSHYDAATRVGKSERVLPSSAGLMQQHAGFLLYIFLKRGNLIASAGTSRDSCGVQSSDKRNALCNETFVYISYIFLFKKLLLNLGRGLRNRKACELLLHVLSSTINVPYSFVTEQKFDCECHTLF